MVWFEISDIVPIIPDENVLTPAIVSSPVFITAPAAATLVASVTSADASMASNLLFNVVVKSFSVRPPSPTV